MKKMIIGLLLCPSYLMCIEEKWLEHTYRNTLDNPVKIITQYTQVTQGFVQPRKRRKVVSKKIACNITHTLEPHETKTIILKGDPLSARKIMPGNLKVVDLDEHDYAVVPKYNVHDRNTFVVYRTKKDKLKMQAQ
jgi:hypothetical protein